MEIIHRGRPNFSWFCLMAESFPDWHVFKNTFILNTGNIRAFINFHQKFEGKFVFDKKNPTLAISPGAKRTHRQIAGTIRTDKEIDKNEIVGAWLYYHKAENTFVFSLGDSSGYYGCPKETEFNEVITYLMSLLEEAGFKPSKALCDDHKIIVGLPADP